MDAASSFPEDREQVLAPNSDKDDGVVLAEVLGENLSPPPSCLLTCSESANRKGQRLHQAESIDG